MLPEKLSTDLTSLVEHEDRHAVVVQFTLTAKGTVTDADLFCASVKNQARLTYRGVDAWLNGSGPLPPAAAAVPGLDEQLKVQDDVARRLAASRREHGALDFDTAELRVGFAGDVIRELGQEHPNRAKSLIENLMVAANEVTATFLDDRGLASIRRVVREPARWDRIVAIAASLGERLPAQPDSRALGAFLSARRAVAPDAHAELSHTIIKLIGSGEYVVDKPGGDAPGHFGLAVKDYTHSTAPNRRFPDLVTQRLVKATLSGRPSPYADEQLQQLARWCTEKEDAANKVERQVRKSAAALVVASQVGKTFDAVVTGASSKGTFVRVVAPLIEGKVVHGQNGLDVGDRVHVQLRDVDVERGFIDFVVA